MALPRKKLEEMGLTEEQIEAIIQMNSESVDGLTEELRAMRKKAEKLEDVEKELDALRAKGESERKAFEDYKKEQAARETQAAREKAARAYFEAHGITGANLEIAMRGARDEISSIDLDGESIKDEAKLNELVKGTFSGLVVTKSKQGAATATPPANTGGGMTKEDILKIKDTGMRQKAIAENLNLFRRG